MSPESTPRVKTRSTRYTVPNGAECTRRFESRNRTIREAAEEMGLSRNTVMAILAGKKVTRAALMAFAAWLEKTPAVELYDSLIAG